MTYSSPGIYVEKTVPVYFEKSTANGIKTSVPIEAIDVANSRSIKFFFMKFKIRKFYVIFISK